MTKRSGRAAVGAAVACLMTVPAAAQIGQPAPAYHAPVISDTGKLAGPRQPIFFRHDVHAGQYQIPCLYCHATVAVSSEPGIPSMQTCFGCHQLVAGGKRPFGGGSTLSAARDSAARAAEAAEVRKVQAAWLGKKPPEWVRIHALPGFVRFPHMRHIKVLGTESCINCHGDVRAMSQVYQVATLKMGWCVNCHVQRQVSRDCTLCHY
ncbi:MAG: cytochrome c3 family protein [Gemmatimonadales bacterium]